MASGNRKIKVYRTSCDLALDSSLLVENKPDCIFCKIKKLAIKSAPALLMESKDIQ